MDSIKENFRPLTALIGLIIFSFIVMVVLTVRAREHDYRMKRLESQESVEPRVDFVEDSF